MAKFKELNDLHKIIYVRSFKNLLKLSYFFAKPVIKRTLRLEVLLGIAREFTESKFKNKKIIEVEKAGVIMRAMKGNETEMLFDTYLELPATPCLIF